MRGERGGPGRVVVVGVWGGRQEGGAGLGDGGETEGEQGELGWGLRGTKGRTGWSDRGEPGVNGGDGEWRVMVEDRVM